MTSERVNFEAVARKLAPFRRKAVNPAPPTYKAPQRNYGIWANKLMENLIDAKLSGPEYRMALWIGRQTIGWQRACVPVRIKDVAKALRMHDSQASRAASLVAADISAG